MSDREAIVRALDALELGDHLEAEAILLGVFESGSNERPFACDQCAMRFEFPGLRDAHILATHSIEDTV